MNINQEFIAYVFETNPYAIKILDLNKNARINIIPFAVGGGNKKIRFEKGHYVNSLSTDVLINEKTMIL